MINEINYICGCDEVGRGPLAGPVVACAVLVDNYHNKKINISTEPDYQELFKKSGMDLSSENHGHWQFEVKDSKKLSKSKREQLYEKIISNYKFAVSIIEHNKIDEVNILNATKLAIQDSVKSLYIKPEIVLVDGNMKFNDPRFKSIEKGDDTIFAISCASIIAKVTRDRIMEKLDVEHPEYGWVRNSGYGTKEHRDAIEKFGITKYHRKSFCKKYI